VAQLFDSPAAVPEGFVYREDVLTPPEEVALLAQIRSQPFHQVQMRGVVARRRVIQYGWKYAFDRSRLSPGPPIPEFLLPLRDRVAPLAALAPDVLTEALLTEYAPGAPIGWHRDAPGFGIVIGVSLLAPCRFRFRRWSGAAIERVSLVLERRSAYILCGPARTEWEHSIPDVESLRYSVTFRTLKADASA